MRFSDAFRLSISATASPVAVVAIAFVGARTDTEVATRPGAEARERAIVRWTICVTITPGGTSVAIPPIAVADFPNHPVVSLAKAKG